jgi:hypothetical protein
LDSAPNVPNIFQFPESFPVAQDGEFVSILPTTILLNESVEITEIGFVDLTDKAGVPDGTSSGSLLLLSGTALLSVRRLFTRCRR